MLAEPKGVIGSLGWCQPLLFGVKFCTNAQNKNTSIMYSLFSVKQFIIS
jgi:hypothetical protein